MPDETHLPDEPDRDDLPEIAPSTIFVEMMRQAAVARQAVARPAPQEPPSATPEATPAPSVADATPAPTVPSVTDAPTPARPMRERLTLSVGDSLHSPAPAPAPQAPPVQEQEPPPIPDTKLEAQRIQRVQRRKERVRARRIGIIGSFLRTVFVVVLAGFLASTIFTWFTSPDFLDRRVVSGLVVANATFAPTQQPTALPTPNYLKKVGIVSGHRGPENDPGAVCPDGLTEASINFDVATRVVRNLRALGYSVDLLDEFDARLNNYQAVALVSIHANTCQDFGEFVSGFLVAKAAVRPEGGQDSLLAECIARHYGERIAIQRRFSLTADMTDYHTFREIHPLTPAAIIELGFMKDDREILTTRQDDMAQAITDGVLCFLQPPAVNPNAEFVPPPTPNG